MKEKAEAVQETLEPQPQITVVKPVVTVEELPDGTQRVNVDFTDESIPRRMFDVQSNGALREVIDPLSGEPPMPTVFRYQLPPGGTVGQLLTKTGEGDYEVGWADAGAPAGTAAKAKKATPAQT